MASTAETRNYYLRTRSLEARVEARRKAEQRVSQPTRLDGGNSTAMVQNAQEAIPHNPSLNGIVFEA